ncbi:tyrosine-type recombinase/integrase [Cupriavidus metallidurans]
MLVRTGLYPPFAIVDAQRLMPRYWATAWMLAAVSSQLSVNTQMTRLRHLDAFYAFVDEHYGRDALDDAISTRDAQRTQQYVESFYFFLTSQSPCSSTTVQRWDTVRGFLQHVAQRLAVAHVSWQALSALLASMARLRKTGHGRVRFIRAIPAVTLRDLLALAEPGSPRNPCISTSIQWRNWLVVNLLLLAGLRRGELMLLGIDALKRDIDPDSGEWVQWLDVTTNNEPDMRTTKPSFKTAQSHRQIPISASLADLYEEYVTHHRHGGQDHGFLLTASNGAPISAESMTKVFRQLSKALSPQAIARFRERAGGRIRVSPHDMRHTCATMRFAMFMMQNSNRDLALQRMRAFFGWSRESTMPEHYARAAIQDDLLKTWDDLFDHRTQQLRETRV